MIGTNKPSNEAENLATQATDATPSYAQVRQKSKAPIFAHRRRDSLRRTLNNGNRDSERALLSTVLSD